MEMIFSSEMSLPLLVTLMMEALSSSETSVFTRAPRRNIPETPFFRVTAVKTSNITLKHNVLIFNAFGNALIVEHFRHRTSAPVFVVTWKILRHKAEVY
jgi:hypothetical protein